MVFKRYNFGKIWSLATKKCSKVPMTDMFVFNDHAELDLMRTRYIKALERSGRFSINTWAWISYHGLRICWRIENRFNAQNYVNILEYVMLPSVRQIYPNNFIYQQDYCPVHTAHVVTQRLRNNNTETLPSPAKRPDLNCIENVWGRMAKEC
jgi:hypothetical protein